MTRNKPLAKHKKGGNLTKAERVVLALAIRPMTLSELREMLQGALDPTNPTHAELIHRRPFDAIKAARSQGYGIRLSPSGYYWLYSQRAE